MDKLQRLTIALAGAACLAAVSSASAAEPQKIVPGTPVTLTIPIPISNRAAGTLRYTIEPSPGVQVLDDRKGTLVWEPTAQQNLHVLARIVVDANTPAGPFLAVRLDVVWSDGTRTSIPVLIQVKARTESAGKSAKDIEAELVVVPGTAGPGGAVRLFYTILNYEETEQRVRLRVVAGPGWKLLDPQVEQEEFVVQPVDVIDGELTLVVSDDARVGERQLVRFLVEVVGEPGEIEAQGHVSVVRHGSVRPGIAGLSTSSTFGLARLGAGGMSAAQKTGALNFSTKFGRASSLSFTFDDGLQQNFSNFRYEEPYTRAAGNVRHAGWDVSFGNAISSSGNALTGPYVRGRGASVRRPSGRLVADLLVTQPTTIDGNASGHLVRGRAGLRTKTTTVAFAVSDFNRPVGGYTTLPTVQVTVLDPDAAERLEIERRLTAQSASNAVRGVGAEWEFSPSPSHRLTTRGGSLWVSSASGLRASGFAGEASYSFINPRTATFNTHWRETPPSVQGIYLPGDEIGADGSLRIVGDLRFVGQAYRNSNDTLDSVFLSKTNGTSLGMRFMRGGSRIEARGNYRESQFDTKGVRRTVSVNGGVPVGPLSASVVVELGQQERTGQVEPLSFYHGDLRWIGKAGSTLSIGYSRQGATPSLTTQRLDLLTSYSVRDWEFAGGAWASSGYAFGGKPGGWGTIGIPIASDMLITVGADYSPVTWTAVPTWRGLISIRQRFVLPLPFLPSTQR